MHCIPAPHDWATHQCPLEVAICYGIYADVHNSQGMGSATQRSQRKGAIAGPSRAVRKRSAAGAGGAGSSAGGASAGGGSAAAAAAIAGGGGGGAAAATAAAAAGIIC